MINVAHHGLHWADDGVAWVQQGTEGWNGIGLKDLSPFNVMRGCAACNHRIVLPTKRYDNLEQHPLFEIFYPIPKKDFGIYFIEDDGDPQLLGVLNNLLSLSSSIRIPMMPCWNATRSKLLKQLFSTNLQPLVLTDIKPRDARVMNEAIQLAASSPSKLVLVGRSDVPVAKSIHRIDPDMKHLPATPPDMRRMGATALWRHMRGE